MLSLLFYLLSTPLSLFLSYRTYVSCSVSPPSFRSSFHCYCSLVVVFVADQLFTRFSPPSSFTFPKFYFIRTSSHSFVSRLIVSSISYFSSKNSLLVVPGEVVHQRADNSDLVLRLKGGCRMVRGGLFWVRFAFTSGSHRFSNTLCIYYHKYHSTEAHTRWSNLVCTVLDPAASVDICGCFGSLVPPKPFRRFLWADEASRKLIPVRVSASCFPFLPPGCQGHSTRSAPRANTFAKVLYLFPTGCEFSNTWVGRPYHVGQSKAVVMIAATSCKL